MSEHSQIDCDSDQKDNICRDFLRNVCKRGKSCRYRHPDPEEAEALGRKDLVFCHDYQNKECKRFNCKFVHCTKQEEEYFHSTGRLPEHVSAKLNLNGSSNKIPICKDYLNGDCRRSGRCRFRHISMAEYEMETKGIERRPRLESYDRLDIYEPLPKRRAYEDDRYDNRYYDHASLYAERRAPPISHHYQLLDEENRMLIHKIGDLKKQVQDLTATNEFLLDQNAQLRVSKQTLVSPISQQLIPHTLTPTLAPLAAPSITQLSQLPLSSDLGNASLGADLAATHTSIAPMVPVTLGQGIAQVSIAPSQVTIPTASLSQSVPHTLMTSTALISYPIMTQSLRPVIPQSLGHT